MNIANYFIKHKNLLFTGIVIVYSNTLAFPVSAESSKLVESNSQYLSNNAVDLLAQDDLTRVTGVEIVQTENGLELVLETVAGSERLVPLILPEGNDLVIDILDATLAFSIRNGVTELNPAPGISSVTVNKGDENNIRVRITGENQTPSAEIVTEKDDLVLSITPESTTAEQEPDEEIEVIATGQGQEGSDYFVPEAGVTRNNTPIIDTPNTVQVVPRQVFEDRGATEFRDALSRNAVGVVTNGLPRSNFSNVLIRGFDVSNSTLLNGVPQTFFTFSPPRELSNVEQLEILSGSASIIGGQVSPGGVINIVTKQPSLEPFYDLSVSYDTLDSIEGALDLSGPLNESKTVAYRLNASIYHSETFIDVDDVDLDRFSVAPVISWQISEQTKLSFEGLYFDNRTPQIAQLPASGTVLDNPNGDVPPDQFLGEPNFDDNDRIIAQIGYNLEHDFNDNWSLRHVFRYTNLQVEQNGAFPSALQDDLRTLERFGFTNTDDINNYQATAYVTGEFETGSINHELSVGIDYVFEEDFFDFEELEAENIDIFEPEYVGGVGEVVDSGTILDTNDGLGLYLQDRLKIFEDRLILSLGGRLDFVGTSSEDLVDDSSPVETQNDSAFSPKVGILYKIADNLSVYGSFSQSFEQETGVTAEAETFEPSRGTQFEIGAKANWLDNRLSTTLALYDITLTNVATQDPENSEFEIQTGEQKSQGIELQTNGEILPGWNITASYAFTDTEITEDNVFEVGNSFTNVPENAVNFWSTYFISEGSLSGLGFGLGLFYVGEREGDLDNSFQLDDYLRTDAAIYYRRNDLNLALNFKNIFDVNYVEQADFDDLSIGIADPFTVQFSASYRF
ncbi:TonB-dependent siderophore receptor [Pleurocapsa sp. CCALA 161]|uniref:TonB-dependent siderophore receptor n=1 Tax=Pleurocapsa sp. CCALA 161 TaxID=2107688 RepID=UPI000D07CDDF|nr:TonB-dependent siderophore receptor [Pleurocapsa sp. CCALA 161]PSB09512.1 TonB-dependent siderophore receptor [Pleurocapsa sp. CCALA 161]